MLTKKTRDMVRKQDRSYREYEAGVRLRKPPLCDECGVNRADPPSKLCPGCQAYAGHQQ